MNFVNQHASLLTPRNIAIAVVVFIVFVIILVVAFKKPEAKKEETTKSTFDAQPFPSATFGGNFARGGGNNPVWWLGAQHAGRGGTIDTPSTQYSIATLTGTGVDTSAYCKGAGVWNDEVAYEAAALAQMQAVPGPVVDAVQAATATSGSYSDDALTVLMNGGAIA